LGGVGGRVIDQIGATLPGVDVELTTRSAVVRTTTSDAAGRCAFDRVDVESAELTFRLLNFSTVRHTLCSWFQAPPASGHRSTET
jgi:hypothetical protein